MKDRDSRQAAEGTEEMSAKNQSRGLWESERERNGPVCPCKAHPGIQPYRRAGEMWRGNSIC